MATYNLDSADLKAVDYEGWIHEDVMDQIWDISRIPLPLTDMIGSPDTVDNAYASWNIDKLADPDVTNAHVDGIDVDQNDAATGSRVGNHCQTSLKEVKVSDRADSSDTMGATRELARQVMRRQQELRRDVEAISLENQASVEDDGNATPGKIGGLPAWITTVASVGATGSTGGFANGTVSAFTPGTPRAGTETQLKALISASFEEGADPTVLMSLPAAIEGLNNYLFTDSAQIATLQGETSADESGRLVAKGSVNVYVAPHGQILEFVPNRLQQKYGTNECSVFGLDPSYLRHGHLYGYRVRPLAKTGLAEKRLMAVDWTLKVLNESAHFLYADIDYTAPWTA